MQTSPAPAHALPAMPTHPIYDWVMRLSHAE
ncbi:hypothetical protein HNR55_000236 [Acetobacter lovaniensis]|uniref:Uncharacterized protein n=1 Tax=Acetobacter lovaniensis TaxID=104100 RepID=A0A841QBA5_9PROT|nr:hypothetical protein [Acetobacter lovaniensis]